MSIMTGVIPHGRPFTVDDLEGMPDDGNRYELIDGLLLVTPARGWEHQEVLLAAAAGRRDLLPRIAPAREYLGPRGQDWLDTVMSASGVGSGN